MELSLSICFPQQRVGPEKSSSNQASGPDRTLPPGTWSGEGLPVQLCALTRHEDRVQVRGCVVVVAKFSSLANYAIVTEDPAGASVGDWPVN